ncbi:ACSS3 synthetase, partial [Corythaeola cristata]|nr:ACSS3 synthetase [Corythaeola cristata]
QVSKLADVMVRHGVKKGDRVIIYMPMIPQTVYCMLACARIGAIHSLIFGGFASKELSVRIDHAKVIGIWNNKHHCIKYSYKCMSKACFFSREDNNISLCVACGLNLFGVVRPTGGYAVMLNWTMSAVYGLKPGEVWWAASDLGWVVGHSYICYGPLLHGNTTVLYEGKPVGTPDAGAYFRVLAEHEVAAFFTSPTAIRAIRQQDPEAALGKRYSLKRTNKYLITLRTVLTGSTCVLLTESGSAITASCIGLGNSTTPPPGQAGKPVPGYNGKIVLNMLLEKNIAYISKIKSFRHERFRFSVLFIGFMGNEWVFLVLFLSLFLGYYDTMDAGYMDENGYLYVLSRADDVINVAGHRISAGAIEECVLLHHAVADCAVVGQEDPLKGHVPFALCVLREGVKTEEEKILEEIVERVRTSIGPVAAFQKAAFVKQLPKTRSGKIPRSALSALVSGKPYKVS